uniref:hypothetical protein n=1 Tax=Serratia entomophila TaxID=42906 RepID=UPI001F4C0C4D|nr:hypothetical protein [Serratia entomophila]
MHGNKNIIFTDTQVDDLLRELKCRRGKSAAFSTRGAGGNQSSIARIEYPASVHLTFLVCFLKIPTVESLHTAEISISLIIKVTSHREC